MNDKPLKGKTVAHMVANGFEEIELTQPQKRLIEAGATVKVVSGANGLVNGWYDGSWGHFFPVDADLASTLAVDYDALVVPGGTRSIEKMASEPHASRVLKAFLREDMPVVMFGDAAKLLAASDDAAGRSVTASPEAREELVAAGAEWQDSAVVEAGNLVTAGGREAMDEALDRFIALLARYRGEVNQAA